MVKEIVYLDLKINQILGYERPKVREIVDSLKRGILNQDSIPAVNVFFENGVYKLCSNFKTEANNGNLHHDGGHHRSIAYCELEIPMPVFIYGTEIYSMSPLFDLTIGYIPLEEIPIISNKQEYERKKEIFPNYK